MTLGESTDERSVMKKWHSWSLVANKTKLK